MIRIAIVEDNEKYSAILADYLERFEEQNNVLFKISSFTDGSEIIKINHGHFDIILMDIEMEMLDGMTAAKIIREKDQDVIIMFITQAPQYAMNGFEVDAFDYVLKPINYFAFSQRIERAIERLNRRSRKSIMIETGGFVRKILVSSIRYVEVSNHEAIYFLLDESLILRESLKISEKRLSDARFFKCNQSYIVNFDFIDKVESDMIHIEDKRIPISRSRKKEFLDSFNNYINEVSK